MLSWLLLPAELRAYKIYLISRTMRISVSNYARELGRSIRPDHHAAILFAEYDILLRCPEIIRDISDKYTSPVGTQ